MDIQIVENRNKAPEVFLKDDLTIYTVESVYNELKQIYNSSKELTINLSQISEIDTAGFQLLYAIKKDAESVKKSIHYVKHSDAVLKYMDLFGTTGLFKDKILISKSRRSEYDFSYGIKVSKFSVYKTNN